MASTARFLVFLIVASALAPPASHSRPAKVSVALYYESLCPYCSSFIVNHLAGIFRDGLISVVDLDLVPYGNARLGPKSTISCQHGPNECLLNTVEACAIDTWSDLHKQFSFIYCVESLIGEHKYVEWHSCFSKVGLDSQAVLDCCASGHGKELELYYAAQTDSLQPPHRFVPWVVVNGRPLYEDYINLEAYICKAYGGDPPMACLDLLMSNHQEAKAESQVCYALPLLPVTRKREMVV